MDSRKVEAFLEEILDTRVAHLEEPIEATPHGLISLTSCYFLIFLRH